MSLIGRCADMAGTAASLCTMTHFARGPLDVFAGGSKAMQA
jgi:hypothetical protein